MRGILLAEIHQTLRSHVKPVIFIGLAVVVTKLLGGPAGGWMMFLAMLPNLSVSVGVGTLSEEYSKGQLRYLYGMSVRPGQLWIVKLASGMSGVLEFAALIGGLAWLTPTLTPAAEADPLAPLGVSPVTAAATIVVYSLFAYSAGLAAMGFSRNVKAATLLSSIFIYVPVLLLTVISMIQSRLPSPAAIMIVALAGMGVLLTAATVQFFLRNPFIDQPWRWAGLGVGTGAAVILTTALTAAVVVVVLPGLDMQGLNQARIGSANVSPNGEYVAVTHYGAANSQVEIRDAQGQHLYDLEDNANLLRSGNADTLSYSPDGRYLLYQTISRTFNPNQPAQVGLHLVELRTGQQTPLKHIQVDGLDDVFYTYNTWTIDSRYLLAEHRSFGGFNGGGSQFARQDIETGEIQVLDLPQDDRIWQEVAATGQVTLTHHDDEGVPIRIELLNWDGEPTRTFDLPAETESVMFRPDSRQALLVRAPVGHERVRKVLDVLDLETGELRTLLDGPPLPDATLADAVKGRLGYLNAFYSPAGRWIVVTLSQTNRQQTYVVNVESGELRLINEQDPNESDAPYYNDAPVFSRTESRLYFIQRSYPPAQDDEARLDNTLVVIDLEQPDAPPILKTDISADIYELLWKGDHQLIYTSAFPQPRGDLLALDLRTGETASLIPDPAAETE